MSVGATLQQTLKVAEATLAGTGIDTARLDAEILMAHVLGCGRMALYGRLAEPVADDVAVAFAALIERRRAFEPVAYLTCEQEFWSLPFRVTPDTLIPRPDTETLVETVLKETAGQSIEAILDLGTGSGCIFLSLLDELEEARGTAVDISHGALTVAQENAVALGLSERATFLQGSWFEPLDPDAQFDVIVSNPPYIPTGDLEGLMPDVRDFEPMGALDGGIDGLAPYRLIAALAPLRLKSGGVLAVEVGILQAEDVLRLFTAAGLKGAGTVSDLGGVERVVYGKKS